MILGGENQKNDHKKQKSWIDSDEMKSSKDEDSSI